MREHRIEIDPYKIVDQVNYSITRFLNHHVEAKFGGLIRDGQVDECVNSALEDEAWVKIYFLTVIQKNLIRNIFDRLQSTDGKNVLSVAKFLGVKGINFNRIDQFIETFKPKTTWQVLDAIKAFEHINEKSALKVLQYYQLGMYMKMAGLTKVDQVFKAIRLLKAEEFFKIKMDPKEFSGFLAKNDFLERKELIFYGVLTEFEIREDNGVKRLHAVARSGSYMMDIIPHTRLFQDAGGRYENILYTVTREYIDTENKSGEGETPEMPFKMNVEDKTIAEMDKRDGDNGDAPPKSIIVQYKETDWEFIKRLASHFGTVVIPRYRKKVETIAKDATEEERTDKEERMKFFFGLPDPEAREDAADAAEKEPGGFPFHEYQLIKKMALKHDGYAVALAASSERYKIESERELYELGATIHLPQGPGGGLDLYISQSKSEYDNNKGEMLHNYILKSKESLIQHKAYLDGVSALVIDDFAKWNLEFKMLADNKAADFGLGFREEELVEGKVTLWESKSQQHRALAALDKENPPWNTQLDKPPNPEIYTIGVSAKPDLQGKSLIGKVTKLHDKFIEVELDEDENLPWNQKPPEGGTEVAKDITQWHTFYKKFKFSSIYSSDDGSGIHWMPKEKDRIRIHFPDRDEENGYAISFFYEKDNLPSNRTDPDNTSIKNPQDKEVLFSPNSIYATNNNGLGILLQEGQGINFNSNGYINIQSDSSVSIEAGGALNFSAPNGILMQQGNASMEITPGKVKVTTAKAKYNGAAELGG